MSVAAPNSAAISPAAAATNYQQAQILESQGQRIWQAVQIFFVCGALSIIAGIKYGLLPALGCAAVTAFFLFHTYQLHQADIEKTSSSYQLVKALLDKNPAAAQGFLDRWESLGLQEKAPNKIKHLETAFGMAAYEGYNDLIKPIGLRLRAHNNDPQQTWLEDQLSFAVSKKNVFVVSFLLETWDFTDSEVIGDRFSDAVKTKQKDLIDPFLKKYPQLIPPNTLLEAMKKAPDDLAIEIFQKTFPHHPNDLNFGKRSSRTWSFLIHCCNENRVALMKQLLTHRNFSNDAAVDVYFMLDKSTSGEMTKYLQDTIRENRLYDRILTIAESQASRWNQQKLKKLRERIVELT